MSENSTAILSGIKASGGLCMGPVFLLKELKPARVSTSDFVESTEIEKLNNALMRSLNDIERLKTSAKTDESKEILEAHSALIDDPEVKEQTLEKIKSEKMSSYAAYSLVIDNFKEAFRAMNDDYIKQRILDLEDISQRVLFYIENPDSQFGVLNISKPSILVAKDLTPSQILSLDKSQVLGIVLQNGSAQSHTSILARSMEIPCIVGVQNIYNHFDNISVIAILNANDSKVILNPTKQDVNLFQQKNELEILKQKKLNSFKGKATKTKSGIAVPLGANISGPQDIESVLKNDAELVGLYRTEFLFLDRNSAPSEDEQFAVYKKVFEGVGTKRVIIRTLDIGGDKAITYLNMPAEENPFLGVRGIRLCLKFKNLFKDQLRAILRASSYASDLGIMFPMISTIEEIQEAKKIYLEVLEELKSKKINVGNKIDLGIMVEVPSIAWQMEEVSKEVSFVSVGTNDLFQYSNACDRMNPELKSISNPVHTGFMRFLKFIADESLKYGLHIGVCGSIAHHPQIMPYLIKIGVQELSMTAQHILEAREVISEL